jgi:hypothetical protein
LSDVGIVLSLVSSDGVFVGFDDDGCFVSFDDVSRLFCFVDGLPCRDFVHCFRFMDSGGSIVLVWRCPRFKKVSRK